MSREADIATSETSLDPAAGPAASSASNTRFCPCGSGLSRTHCCALDLATLGSGEAPRHLLPLEERADELLRAGDVAEAERLAKDVLELAPGRAHALAVLYEIRK